MLNLFSTELLKLRHSKIHWLVLFTALPANLIAIGMYLSKDLLFVGPTEGIDLQDIFYRQGMVLTILGPFVFALLTSYIFIREYEERTINQLFAYPVSRIHILLAKLGVVFMLMATTSALSYASAFVITMIKFVTGSIGFDQVWMGVRMNGLICLLSFGTVPVAAGISMWTKSIIPTAVLGAGVTLISLIAQIGHGMNVILFPWLTPYWPVRDLARFVAETGPNPFVTSAIIILALTFVSSLMFSVIYYSKSDVHSGS